MKEIAEIGFSEIAGAGRNKRKAKVSELNNIRILADTSAVELYLNDGEIVFSTRYYPDREDLQLKVKAENQGKSLESSKMYHQNKK